MTRRKNGRRAQRAWCQLSQLTKKATPPWKIWSLHQRGPNSKHFRLWRKQILAFLQVEIKHKERLALAETTKKRKRKTRKRRTIRTIRWWRRTTKRTTSTWATKRPYFTTWKSTMNPKAWIHLITCPLHSTSRKAKTIENLWNSWRCTRTLPLSQNWLNTPSTVTECGLSSLARTQIEAQASRSAVISTTLSRS